MNSVQLYTLHPTFHTSDPISLKPLPNQTCKLVRFLVSAYCKSGTLVVVDQSLARSTFDHIADHCVLFCGQAGKIMILRQNKMPNISSSTSKFQ